MDALFALLLRKAAGCQAWSKTRWQCSRATGCVEWTRQMASPTRLLPGHMYATTRSSLQPSKGDVELGQATSEYCAGAQRCIPAALAGGAGDLVD